MRTRSRAVFGDVPIEQVRHYWDARPCNVRHSPKPVGSQDYYDEVESRKYRVEPHILEFADFPRWKGKRVLEIGCGIGTDTISFARHGAKVTAVDLSERSLEIARQRAEVFGLEDGVRFFKANAEELSLTVPVEPYDLVYAFGVLHHTPQPDRALEEMRQYLAPDGSLKIMLYHRWSWKVFSILLTCGRGRFWRLNELIARHSEAQAGCPVTYTYTRGQARRWLARHGFRVEAMRVEHIFPYRIQDYVQYRYTKVWYLRWLPPRVFRLLERAVGWHLCVTATVGAGRI